jgi:pyridoxamine 5'-phosphate oxidase
MSEARPVDVAALRREYARAGLSRADLDPDPVRQFDRWFSQACEVRALDPNAAVLATVDADGAPDQRTVLLKAFDRRGFVFYTNLASNKARHIAGNSSVSLLFLWLELERQLIVRGRAERVGTGETLKYFATRPRGSQIGAWVSPQSSVISSRKLLEMKFEEMKRKFGEAQVPLPDFWGGFRVVPDRVEFWQGRPSRLHDRFLYTRDGEEWRIERLAP